MTSNSGSCLCGAVRFTAEAVETHHHACHCGMCRRWSGGPVLATSVEGVTFEGTENIGRYKSSDWAERGFCKKCGSNLFYHLFSNDQYMMSVGAFDDPSPFSLVGEIFIDRKPDGYTFAGDHPRLTEAETVAKFVASGDDGA